MRYRAKPGQRIPMPDRPGQFVPEDAEGAAVNPMNPYYARLIAEGDLVPATAAARKAGKTERSK